MYLFRAAKKHQNQIVAVQPLEGQNSSQMNVPPSRKNQDRKAAKTISLVVGVYILLYIPFLSYTISQAKYASEPEFLVGFYWFYSVWMINSSTNPYIYCARNSRYRRAFKAILRLQSASVNFTTDTQGTAGN